MNAGNNSTRITDCLEKGGCFTWINELLLVLGVIDNMVRQG